MRSADLIVLLLTLAELKVAPSTIVEHLLCAELCAETVCKPESHSNATRQVIMLFCFFCMYIICAHVCVCINVVHVWILEDNLGCQALAFNLI